MKIIFIIIPMMFSSCLSNVKPVENNEYGKLNWVNGNRK